MNRLFILFFIISYATYAQSSVETSIMHEQKARMTSIQRIELQAFESLSVIDTDENKSYVFLAGKWTPEFTDAQINAATKQREALKNTNASWKEFDEASKPIQADTPKNTALSATPINKDFQPFSYQTMSAKEFYQNDFTIKLPAGKQLSFVKVYFKNQTGIQDLALAGTQAQISWSEQVVTFKYFADSRSPIKLETNAINNNEVLGVLIAFVE